jgi:hypothetical protein
VKDPTSTFITPGEVVTFVKAMMREPNVSALFYEVGKNRNFTPQEAEVISDFIENYRKDRASRSLPPDYGFLSSGLVVMRMIVSGVFTGPDDQRVEEYLKKVLIAER